MACSPTFKQTGLGFEFRCLGEYSLAARCRVAATSEVLGGAVAKIEVALGSEEAKLCHLAWPASCPWYATTAIAHLVKARESMIAKVDR